MTMTIRYEGVSEKPIKLPSWSTASKKDYFINLQVWMYLNQLDTREINWARDVRVTVKTKEKTKNLRFDIVDFVRIEDGNPQPLKLKFSKGEQKCLNRLLEQSKTTEEK